MILHIGGEVELPINGLVTILKYDALQYKINGDFIKSNENHIIAVSDEPPKSIVVTSKDNKTTIYLSPLSTLTLQNRFLSVSSFSNVFQKGESL